jgi:hypothetical protein
MKPDFGERVALVNPAAVVALDDQSLVRLAVDEAASGVEDFMERRMDWLVNPEEHAAFAARLTKLSGFPNTSGAKGGGHGN